MTFPALVRWTALASIALLTTACGMQGAPGQAALQPAVLEASESKKPPEYEKIFPVAYRPQPYPVKVIAHRGYSSVAPENTLAAIQAAIDAGADAIEFDIRLSKDGHVVVIHDSSVDRTTDGEGKVSEMTLQELQSLDAGGWFDPAFRGERIPTLEDVLLLMRGKATPVIEVKVASREIAGPLAETLKRLDMTRHAYVTTFYGGPLRALQTLAPDLSRAVLVTPLSSPSGRALNLRAGTTQAYHAALERDKIDHAHSLGLEVHAWTVNRIEDMNQMISMGIDGITTDEVSTLRQVLKERFPGKPPVNPHSLWGRLYPIDRDDTTPVTIYNERDEKVSPRR